MTNIEELKAWSGEPDRERETLYQVATFSYMCTAYTRTALRRALALQYREKVWSSTEYVNAARAMVTSLHTLPDVRVWRLTKTELLTIHIAFEWRRAKRKQGKADLCIGPDILARWSRIEDEVHRVLREIWHSEGKYWM
ncbi:hypothetical protein [Streptomyces sp. NPDC006355]|uniref:hypothetical protein n=1 Tax=Streptomyces sp. NPDC006355 TaxID=3156758 RepID=UPI0033A37EFD